MSTMTQSGIASGGPAKRTGSQTDFSLQTADVDGIKTAAATPVADTTYEGAALNGALITDGALNTADARNVTVQTGASVGTYIVGSKIIIKGSHPYYDNPNGSPAPETEELLITAANGGESLIGAKCFRPGYPISIKVEAQNDASGTVEVGAGVARALTPPLAWVQCNAAGDIFAHHSGDGNTIRKTVVTAAGSKPIGIDALHAGTTITDMWGKADI